MRILGIDPGFERLGIAILDGNDVVFSECYKTSASVPFTERLLLLGKETERIIKKYKPEAVAIETLFLSTNQKTAMKVSEARGVVLYESAKARLKVFESSPPEIKRAVTGDGRADKKQVIKMVKMLVKINADKQSDDEIDAIAVALTASACIRL